MKYMLMHKDVEVLEFSFSEQRRWARIIDVLNAAHVPVNMLDRDKILLCICRKRFGRFLAKIRNI